MVRIESRNIGIILEAPKEACNDINCPFHGTLSIRGRQFAGTVISAKMGRTAVIEFERMLFLKKYERYEKRRTKLKAHNPDCINAKEGDIVKIAECRPLSKTKSFAIIQKLGAEKGFKEKMEAREAAKIETKMEGEVKVENE